MTARAADDAINPEADKPVSVSEFFDAVEAHAVALGKKYSRQALAFALIFRTDAVIMHRTDPIAALDAVVAGLRESLDRNEATARLGRLADRGRRLMDAFAAQDAARAEGKPVPRLQAEFRKRRRRRRTARKSK